MNKMGPLIEWAVGNIFYLSVSLTLSLSISFSLCVFQVSDEKEGFIRMNHCNERWENIIYAPQPEPVSDEY